MCKVVVLTLLFRSEQKRLAKAAQKAEKKEEKSAANPTSGAGDKKQLEKENVDGVARPEDPTDPDVGPSNSLCSSQSVLLFYDIHDFTAL